MLRMLLVEDDDGLRALLLRLLRHPDVELRGAVDLHSAVAEAAAFLPTVVVTDLMLTGASGVDVIREIRKTQPNVGAVIITGMAPEALGNELHDVPDARVVEKTTDIFQFVNQIQQAAVACAARD